MMTALGGSSAWEACGATRIATRASGGVNRGALRLQAQIDGLAPGGWHANETRIGEPVVSGPAGRILRLALGESGRAAKLAEEVIRGRLISRSEMATLAPVQVAVGLKVG